MDVPDQGGKGQPKFAAGSGQAGSKRYSPARLLRTQWDGLVSLGGAIALAVLSVLDVLPQDQVPTATLGVLALVCFTIVRDNADRETMPDISDMLSSRDAQLASMIAKGDDLIRRSVGELSVTFDEANKLYGVSREAIASSYIDVLGRTLVWKYQGGTGTYLRAETLPRLALSRSQLVCNVWIEIVDPGNLVACGAYAEYRSMLPRRYTTRDKEPWSTERVRKEGYATVVAALWYQSHYKTKMDIHLALSQTASSFRCDMSDDFAIITNEHSESVAQRADAGGGMYARYADELDLRFKQARRVDLADVNIERHFTDLDVLHALRDLLGVMGNADGFLTSDVCSEIAGKAISEKHAVKLGMASGSAPNPYALPE